MIFSTSACTTLEIVHAPVGCLGQPNINVKFTHEEADSMLDSTADKIVLIREIYRARIDAQCSINKKHDELHGMNK
jgi:hypothetical protein